MLVSINDFMPLFLSMLTLLVLFIMLALFCSLLLRNIIPAAFYKIVTGVVILVGGYIWVVPMEMGFYEIFRTFF